MGTDLANVGRRIRELREERDWSQADLAKALGRTQTAVSYWEAGKRAPGLDDLLELAAEFDVSVGDLVPARRQPLPTLLRAVAEQVDQHALATELEEFAAAAEDFDPLEPRIQLQTGRARDTAEALVAASRAKPPIDVDHLAHLCGVRVLARPFADVDGLLLQLGIGAVIGVNSEQARVRQRFTTAHELGHHLLKHADSFHIDFGGALSGMIGEGPHYNWRHERAANEFAANLLMPAAMVRRAFASTKSLTALGKKFEVSTAAMGIRLSNLGLT